MKIKVTEKDIECGIRGDETACAVALAISNEYPASNVLVMRNCIRINGRQYRIPKKAKHFIKSFDYGCAIRPIEFSIF